MNVFSSEAFCSAFFEAYFPGQKTSVEHFRVEDRCFRLPVVGGNAITRWQFIDFYEPVETETPGARELPYLPRVALKRVESWKEAPAGAMPSPFIDWRRFQKWEDFEAHFTARRSNLLADTRRRRRKLERELGPLRYTPDDPSATAQCMKWKSAQYVRSGHNDLFARAENERLFTQLAKRGLLRVSALHAGNRLVAAHLGVLHQGRLHYWIPAHDPEINALSPGRLLLEELMRESHQRGDAEFDFLIGDEEYKWYYATGARVVQELGATPLRIRLRRAAQKTRLWKAARKLIRG